jgi:two-component system, chemotaxis family, chemotaxis protein CheY
MAGDTITRDVIIADNDHIIRSILRSVLEAQKFNVVQAVDGIEAVDYATRTKACLVILDYKMPRLDGFATCAEIRCLPAYAEVPIIILTAFNDDDTRTAAQQAGATMFLTKPFRPVDLLQAVATVLGSPQADRGSSSTTGDRAGFVWKRRQEPTPLDNEQPELSEGRRILNIVRH